MALADKDAPYLVVMLAAGLGWLVTFIADQYSTVPTLEIQKTIVTRPDGIIEGTFNFTNVSRKSFITIHQLDFSGAAILAQKKSPCGKFINVAPYRVADVNPPFETSGPMNSCDLPLSLKELGLQPGAGFGVQLVWNPGGKIDPFLVEQNVQSSTNPFRIVWSNSMEAWISRNLNILLIWGGIVAALIGTLLLLSRKKNLEKLP